MARHDAAVMGEMPQVPSAGFAPLWIAVLSMAAAMEITSVNRSAACLYFLPSMAASPAALRSFAITTASSCTSDILSCPANLPGVIVLFSRKYSSHT